MQLKSLTAAKREIHNHFFAHKLSVLPFFSFSSDPGFISLGSVLSISPVWHHIQKPSGPVARPLHPVFPSSLGPQLALYISTYLGLNPIELASIASVTMPSSILMPEQPKQTNTKYVDVSVCMQDGTRPLNILFFKGLSKVKNRVTIVCPKCLWPSC